MYNIIGAIGTSYTSKSVNYTFTNLDSIVVVDTAGVTQTLPDAILFDKVEFTIVNASDGDITINTTSSQLINNELTIQPSSGTILKVKAVNGNWKITSKSDLNGPTLGKVFVTTKGFNKL